MAKLIIIRHGESVWNLENRFTGWMDVPLSNKGKQEAMRAGDLLKEYKFDKIYVSHLTRAIQTMHLILDTTKEERVRTIYHVDDKETNDREHFTSNASTITIIQSKSIAERYYGDLQGLDKNEAKARWGEEQVHLWRRSFDTRPPGGESLKDTLDRVLPFYEKNIAQDLKSGKVVLVVAHGNSLRAIMKYIENISDSDITNHEIATGIPIVYDMDENLKVISKIELK